MSTTAAAIGRLMKKINRHDTAPISHPPRNGPTAAATPPSPDQAPIARDRSSGENDAWMIARLPGVSSAPPTPCRARAAISVAALGATPQASEATANQIAPIMKMRRRPSRSPSVPPRRSNPARVSVYPLTIHCSVDTPA